MGKDKIHIPILQFADDTLIFCKYDNDMVVALSKIIELFEWSLGQL